MLKVAKFGGTSLSSAAQTAKAIDVVMADPARRYVVVSAPGKRSAGDKKITDLLYSLHKNRGDAALAEKIFGAISNRFFLIAVGLGIKLDLDSILEEIWENISSGATVDYIASRGEYLNGLIIAEALRYQFVDAKDVVRFDETGRYDEVATKLCIGSLRGLENAVIPGFYGSMPDGSIKTFTRGGSDITGSIVAEAVGADVYENWTDVDGFLMADPRIVKNPKTIKVVTYSELRELAYMGACVLHDEAIFPVQKAGIPINIRNTNNWSNDGTMIVPDCFAQRETPGTVVGIAGRENFTVITLAKARMNQEVGFVRKLCGVLEKHGVSFEHMPSGIDTISIIIDDEQLDGKTDLVVTEIKKVCSPESVVVERELAMICVVGRAMARTVGVAAELFGSLAKAGVNVRTIDQGASERSIILGVSNSDYKNAVNAVYKAFAG